MALKTLDERVRDLEDEVGELKRRLVILEKYTHIPSIEHPATWVDPPAVPKRGNPNWVKK